jgi:hypothetical protein
MIVIKHMFTCDICGRFQERDVIVWRKGWDVPIPRLPDGWKKVSGYIVCELHKVKEESKLIIDGKEREARA